MTIDDNFFEEEVTVETDLTALSRLTAEPTVDIDVSRQAAAAIRELAVLRHGLRRLAMLLSLPPDADLDLLIHRVSALLSRAGKSVDFVDERTVAFSPPPPPPPARRGS